MAGPGLRSAIYSNHPVNLSAASRRSRLSVGRSRASTSLLSHTEDANDTSTPVSGKKVFYYTITHPI